ncbi:MAG: hypothetical protein V4561_01785 [Bacteroidota bacterium]|jgi:transposase-like protein
MDCPNCNSRFYVKNGIIKGVQRYKCKNCKYNFTVEQKSTAIDFYKKRIALILYLEGVKVHQIAHLLEVSHVSILKWVKKYGNNLAALRAQINLHSSDPDELE